MENFEFYSPTKVIFGKAVESRTGEQIKAVGGRRVLVHYGSESAKKTGLIDRIIKSLAATGLFYVELGGVVPNPRLQKVYDGIQICKEHQVDFILAVGGGSVIDSAKAIAMGVANEGDVWDYFVGKRVPETSLSIGTVLTIAAAGSETSNSCVITKEEGELKRGYNNDINRPKFAIMNPELTYTLPPYQTACGIVDIMMHTMDRYFSHTKDVDFVDRISEALLQSVIRAGQMAMENPEDYSARADLMWAGSISHNTLTGTGKVTDFAPHQMEHELSGKYDVAHGAGLAAIWGHWARYVYRENPMKFAQFAVRVWNISMDFENPEKTALAGIARTEEYFRSIAMPVDFIELGIDVSDTDLEEMAKKCTFDFKRKVGNFKPLDYEDIVAIFRSGNRCN